MADRKPFNEDLFQHLFATLRSAGLSPNMTQTEALRTETAKLASLLDKEMKLTAIELIRRVEAHIDEAFKKMDKKIDDHIKQ